MKFYLMKKLNKMMDNIDLWSLRVTINRRLSELELHVKSTDLRDIYETMMEQFFELEQIGLESLNVSYSEDIDKVELEKNQLI